MVLQQKTPVFLMTASVTATATDQATLYNIANLEICVFNHS